MHLIQEEESLTVVLEDGEEQTFVKKERRNLPWKRDNRRTPQLGWSMGIPHQGWETDRVRCRREQHPGDPWGQRSHCTKLDRGETGACHEGKRRHEPVPVL